MQGDAMRQFGGPPVSTTFSVRATSSAATHARASCVAGALSVGISSYYDRESWPDLGACSAESELLAHAMREQFGVEAELEENPDREMFWQALERWIDTMKDGGTYLFFYAGHGYEFDGDLYLVPQDSTRTDDDIRLAAIRGMVDRSTINCNVVIFVAACRGTPATEPPRTSFAYESETERWSDRWKRSKTRRNNFLISSACEPGCFIVDAGPDRCGPYARFLAEGFAQDLSIEAHLNSVRAKVAAETDNRELPCFQSSLKANVWLRHMGLPPDCVDRASAVASKEYSHFQRPPSPRCQLDLHRSRLQDIRYMWRTRIDRLVIESNIQQPRILLLTDTEGKSSEETITHFDKTGMGTNYLIHRDGHITQLVDMEFCAWCGNPGFWGTLEHRAKIQGIGLVNEVHNFAVSVALEGQGTSAAFEEEQYRSLVVLADELITKYNIRPWDVVSLAEVCVPPDRYRSPGPHFEWSWLEQRGMTLSLRHAQGSLPAELSDKELARSMETWGYCLGDGARGLKDRLERFRDRYVQGNSKWDPPDSLQCLGLLHTLLEQRERSTRTAASH